MNYTTGDGTATIGDNDYNAQPATTLSFAGKAGEPVTFLVHVNGDKKIESDEVFKVNFTTPTNTFNGRLTMPVPTATGTITNDDSGTITISSTPGSENNPNPNGGGFIFSFSPGVSSDQPTTIYFGLSVGSTATITNDYIFPDPSGSGSVTIPAGATSATVTLPVVNDAVVEHIENIILTVGSVLNPYPTRITTPTGTATTTIVDNDNAELSIIGPVTVSEGNALPVTAEFMVTLNKATAAPFTVDYSTLDGTAKVADNDYVGQGSGVLSFNGTAGESKTIRVVINGDRKIEGDEYFKVLLGALSEDFNGRLTIASRRLPARSVMMIRERLPSLRLTEMSRARFRAALSLVSRGV